MAATVRTACPLNCWDNCLWLVDIEQGKVTGVRGDPEDPYTYGGVCPKARFQVERMYDPGRPLFPLLRTPKGFQRISWDTALDLLASKLKAALGEYGPASIFYYHDSGSMGLLKWLGHRFFRRLGGITEPQGSLCWAAGLKGQEYDFGYQLAHDPMDVVNSRVVVIWGRNPAHTNVHSMRFIRQARENGARVILVDPVVSPTSSVADLVIAPRPGTDAALALAAANVIISEKLIDLPFIAAYTLGFAGFMRHVEKYTPEWAEQVTGVPREKIQEFARLIACEQPACILMGYGLQRYYGGGNAVRACDALAALTGSIGLKGGGSNYANRWVSLALQSIVPPPEPSSPPRLLTKSCLADLDTLTDPPVVVMVVAGANPVNQAPDSAGVLRAMARIPFKVVLDIRWTETCEISDLFLPVATSLEDEDLYFCSWHTRITYGTRAVEPAGEAMPEHVIWRELSGRLGLGDEFNKTPSEWIDLALRPLNAYGIDSSTLKGKSVMCPTAPPVPYSDGKFLTPSGRFEFYSRKAEAETGYPMATYVSDDRDGAEYPLQLISPRHLLHLHSQFYDKVMSERGYPIAYVSREVVSESGLADGDLAKLESPRGAMAVEVRCSDRVRGPVVVVYEGGSVLTGRGVNLLTPSGETDMGHGARYYDCRVRIVPLQHT